MTIMTRQLTFKYDEHDFFQIWNVELNSQTSPDFRSGLYKMFSSAKLKGTKRAFDSIMIDDFSKAYPYILDEVRCKEPPVGKENYDVPELGLYQVQLSRILEEIYCRFVEKKAPARQEAEVMV
ncbi:MAG: hypothetical protein ACRENG_13970 [bacterium]